MVELLSPQLVRAWRALLSRGEAPLPLLLALPEAAHPGWEGEEGQRVVSLLRREPGRLPEQLGALWELARHTHEPTARWASGSHFTPPSVARALVEEALAPLLAEGADPLELTLCDPAAGGGALLIAAARVLSEGRPGRPTPAVGDIVERCLFGAELDPDAASLARHALRLLGGEPPPAGHLIACDALSDATDGPARWCLLPALRARGGFDVVVSNPPFGNAIDAGTARDPAQARTYARRWPAVAVGAYDRASLFAALAVELLRPGGRYGVVQPRASLSAAGAQGLRGWLLSTAPPTCLITASSARLFGGAMVYVVGLVGTRARGQAPPPEVEVLRLSEDGPPLRSAPRPTHGPTWWSWLDEAPAILSPSADLTLAALVEIFAGCAAGAAYELRPHVVDHLGGGGPPLVTAGLIDRYTCRWGQAPARFLGRDLLHPRWPAGGAPPAVRRALERQRRPKLLIAGLSRRLEVCEDPAGALGAVVGTWVAIPRREDLPLGGLCALFNSWAMSYLYMRHFGAKRMGEGNWTIGRRELLATPIPPAWTDPGLLAELAQLRGEGGAPSPEREWAIQQRILAAAGGAAPQLEALRRWYEEDGRVPRRRASPKDAPGLPVGDGV